jgi:hypothetical protein
MDLQSSRSPARMQQANDTHKRQRFATSVVDSPPVTTECLFHMIQWIPLKIRAPQGAIVYEM